MKTLLIIILILIPVSLYGPATNTAVLVRGEVINPYENIWKAVCQVESGSNPDKINFLEGSYGIAQVRRIKLMHFKEISGINYSLMDMCTPNKAKVVFMAFAVIIGPYNPERICREWNGGPKGMKKESTVQYYNKVKKVL